MNEAFCNCQVHRADADPRCGFQRFLNGRGGVVMRCLSLLLAVGAGSLICVVPAGAADTPAPRLEIQALPDGTRKLDMQGAAGSRFELQVSTNLTVWDRWADITFSEPERSVIDSGPNLPPWRFYRLREAAVVAPSEYLLGLGGAGPLASGLSLANQPLSDGAQNLLAVHRTSPGDAAVVEAAGRWGGDTVNFIQQSSVLESRMDASSGMRQETRVRFSVYARENRLWKFDHRGEPEATLWTSLSTTNICSTSYATRRMVPDFADASRSWMFFSTPGPSRSCFSFPDDTRVLGLRLSMTADDAALDVPIPLVPLYDGTGALTGMVVQDGGVVRAVNPEFGNPEDLFSVPNAPLVVGGVTNYTTYTRGFLFGRSAPGRWLYLAVHQNQPEYLMGYDLAARRGPVPIVRLTVTSGTGTPGTLFGDWTDTDGTNVFLAMNSGSLTSSIVRINEDFALQRLADLPGVVNELSLTDDHVVVRLGRRFMSLPKAGGPARDLFTVPDTEDLVPRFRMRQVARTVDHPSLRQRNFITGGKLLWFETVRARQFPSRSAVYSIAVDGSETEPQRLADTSVVTWTAGAKVPWCAENPSHAVYLAAHWTPAATNSNRADYGGQPIMARSAADRSLLFEVGRFPAPETRIGTVSFPVLISKTEMYGEPFQFGQAGVLPIRGRAQTTAGTTAGLDLLYFKSDEPGLIPVTHYGID